MTNSRSKNEIEKHSYTPEFKQKALDHYSQFGFDSTLHAYGISRASVFNWLKKYRLNQSLTNTSTRPHKPRQRIIEPRVLGAIQRLRIQYPFLGKAKLKVMLDEYCREAGFNIISESTIGRLIGELKQNRCIPITLPKFSFEARTGNLLPKTKNQTPKEQKLRREGYIPQAPGELFQLDTVETRISGKKYFTTSAIDYVSCFTFSYTYNHLSSTTAKDFFQKLESVCPFGIKRVQTDNGQENHKHFRQYLKEQGVIQFYNYPRTPKSNGKIERFNGTIQTEFINRHTELLKSNLEYFNRKLMDYLIFYNTKRPHHALDLKTPMQYLIEHNPKSKMYWTRTRA
jgi:putative transposase